MDERSIFMAALERESPPERSAYLDEACRGDAAMRQRVEALLASHEQAGSFLRKPVPERLAEQVATPAALEEAQATQEHPQSLPEGLGSHMGPYKLLQQIGEGGMGTVFLAEQSEPVRRKVALKIIKPGMDSRQVIARFEAERQALALMDHPNIARVFDGGTTGGEPGRVSPGRPYFVMELVKGVPITRFCDEQRLTPRQRLELFVPVCQAVQHAHQKGVIHRDLKPTNVMVCLYDGRPVPKVIDFGIAKATGQKLTERTMFTEVGQVVGTLEYMSPEQAELNQLDIDTRSDIYSLGVLLYELLTGSTPLDRKRLKSAAMLEVLRVIREEEPPRPSTRLSEAKDTLPSISAQRQTEPARLTKLVRGELDWIVMKALEKDRNRRYQTASAFAADVQRYLGDEPVQACPPSGWYQLRKFVRRNKPRLATAALLSLALLVAVGGFGWSVRDRAARQAKAANDLELALDRAELFQGQGNRAEALAALDVVKSLADEAPPDPARDQRQAALKERLDAEALDQEFLVQYEKVRLQVQSRVELRESRFIKEAAFPKLQEALRRRGIEIGVMPADRAAALVQDRPEPARRYLVAALYDCFQRAPKEAVQARQWLISVLNATDKDDWRVRVRDAIGDRKTLEQLAREVDVRRQPTDFLLLVVRGLPAHRKSSRLELLRRIQGAYPADLWANHDLAFELMNNGRPAEAIRYYTAALALRPSNPGIYLNRGRALEDAGEVDAAIADFRRSIEFAPAYAAAHLDLGHALQAKGQVDEAIVEYQKTIKLDPKLAPAHNNLGTALASKGRLDEAIVAYRKAIAIDPKYAKAHHNLGIAWRAKGKLDEAIAEFQEAGRIKPDNADAYNNLGMALYDKGRLNDAIAAYRTAIQIKPDFPLPHNNLGNALRAKGQKDEAIAEYREAVRIDKDFALAHYHLGTALGLQGRLDEAIAAFREAIRIKKDYVDAHHNLGSVLVLQGRLEEGIAEYREVLRLLKDNPNGHPDVRANLRRAEWLAQLKRRLPAVIEGKDQPRDASESLGFAELCQEPYQKQYAGAVRFFAAAFAAEPGLAADLQAGHRYNAACAAALAGCGQGQDADKVDGMEQARLRRQALDWLRADLEAWGRLLAKEPDKFRPAIAQQLRHWLDDADFTGVRGPAALAKLPEAERSAWQQLWNRVTETLSQVQAKMPPKAKSNQ